MVHFKGKQFKQDIIMVAVGYYLRYNLSYRDVSEILRERGIDVCHTTVYDGFKNIVKLSTTFGKNEIARLVTLGEWMKTTLK